MSHPLLEDYDTALQTIYTHVGFVEDWVVYPIDDQTQAIWGLVEGGRVRFADTQEDFDSDGNYYEDTVYTQRFYKKHVYRGEELTLVFCDSGVDGMKYFRLFLSSKEVLVRK